MKNRVSIINNINFFFLIFFMVLFGSGLLAQDAPAWMEYMVREEITDKDYIKAQKILDSKSISTIHITMSDADYELLINEINNEEYLMADMTYESPLIPLDTIEQVGIRLRGAAARHSAKKSFKISFRAFDYDDRDFHDLRKLNLNCDFQDIHLMRAKVCTDLFRLMGVDAARVGYTKLYINGDYRGLFANYEEFDKVFLETRFDDDNGDLYKCDKASFANNSGYWLVTNEETSDNSDINEFIDVLNNTPSIDFKEEIEKVFDVDYYLMSTACNVLLGAWDDYWVLQKNFYFYHDLVSDQFKHIPHDFDGSLGTYWYPKDMDVAHQNVYNWSPTPDRDTPMITRLLAVPEYRNRYTHYLMLLCMYPFSLNAMEEEIDRTAAMIKETLTSDPYWGWSTLNFDIAMHNGLDGTNIKYGLKEFIELRQNSALEQLENIGPFIKQIQRSPLLPSENDPVKIMQLVVDIDNVTDVKLVYKVGNTTEEIEMLDNGLGSDDKPTDFIYTAKIPAIQNAEEVQYYVQATNNAGKTTRYPATYEWESYTINYEPSKIYINELMASNDSLIQDNNGEYDDWFELYNPSSELVDLSGMYVSDDLSKPTKWRLNNITIPAKGFLLIWADSDPEQGSDHVGFKLSGSGEDIGLFDTDENQNVLIDKVTFGEQTAGISYGRSEDGGNQWIFFDEPTPGVGNRDTVVIIDPEDLVDITDFDGTTIKGSNDDFPWEGGSSGSGSPDDERIPNLIDNDVNTKYLVRAIDSWIEISSNTYSIVTGYTITSANDAPTRDPRSWKFLGWDETAQDWVILHTVTANPSWPDFLTPQTWAFNNNNFYKKYRLNITEINGDSQNLMQMAELEIWGGVFTSIEDKNKPNIPEKFTLGQNYPNPFNPSTQIQFSVSSPTNVKLSIYDVLGQHIKTLVDQSMQTGTHKVQWDGTNENGVIVPNAVYFYQMRSNFGIQTKKMLFIR